MPSTFNVHNATSFVPPGPLHIRASQSSSIFGPVYICFIVAGLRGKPNPQNNDYSIRHGANRLKIPSKPTTELPNAPSVAYAAVTHPVPGPAPTSRTRETLALAKDYILPIYARPSIVLDHGKGSWVWDCDGRKYLDLSAGIAVNALGHANEGVSEASRHSFA